MGDDIKVAEFPHMSAIAVFMGKRSYGVLRAFGVCGSAYRFPDGSVCKFDVLHVVSGLAFIGINAKKSSLKTEPFFFSFRTKSEQRTSLLAATMPATDLISIVGRLGYNGHDRWVDNDKYWFEAAVNELKFRANNKEA